MIWDKSPHKGLDSGPTQLPWHPVFTWYDLDAAAASMAVGQDAMIPIIPGNGKWVEHAPYG